MEETYDYIIIGAGSAGCVLAERLSASPKCRVLVLEAGGSDRRFWIKTPIGYGKSFTDPSVNWCFSAVPDAALGGRSPYCPRGKVIGGSGAINAMVWCRGLRHDYDDWRALGNVGWGASDVKTAFEGIERRVGEDGLQRGNGPLWVSARDGEYHPLKHYYTDAARALGWPVEQDLVSLEAEGVGAYHITTKNGRRWSAADGFLHPARRRRNLTVITHALAEKIVIKDNTAQAVVYGHAEQRHTVWARGAVIVAAGAVQSPQLLQCSGIGDGAHLQDMGIPIHYHNPSVGTHLQDHWGINYYYHATIPTLNNVLGTWWGRMGAGIRYLLTRRGPLGLSVNQMGGFVRADDSAPHPDFQLYCNPISHRQNQCTTPQRSVMPSAKAGFILSVNACRPTGRGHIHLTSPHVADPPSIILNCLSTPYDMANIVRGARLIGAIQQTAPMQAAIAAIDGIDPAQATDEAIIEDFRKRSGSVFHLCGTCRMAPMDKGGVVDNTLRVYGVKKLCVADASVFPNITSGNTHAPAVMVGARAAALLSRELEA